MISGWGQARPFNISIMFLSQVLHFVWKGWMCLYHAPSCSLHRPTSSSFTTDLGWIFTFSSCPLKQMCILSTSLVTLYTLLVHSGTQHSVKPLLVCFLHLGMNPSSDMCEMSFLHGRQMQLSGWILRERSWSLRFWRSVLSFHDLGWKHLDWFPFLHYMQGRQSRPWWTLDVTLRVSVVERSLALTVLINIYFFYLSLILHYSS